MSALHRESCFNELAPPSVAASFSQCQLKHHSLIMQKECIKCMNGGKHSCLKTCWMVKCTETILPYMLVLSFAATAIAAAAAAIAAAAAAAAATAIAAATAAAAAAAIAAAAAAAATAIAAAAAAASSTT